jgi:hypothetical protein
MQRLLIAAALLISTNALAADPLRKYSKYGRVVNAQDLSASRSFAIDISAPETNGLWGLMVIWTCLTDASDSVTALNLACTASHDSNTTDYEDQDCSVSSGVCTASDASWTKNPGADTTCWAWRWDVEGYPAFECTYTDTGGDASDTITTYVTFSTK